MRPNDKTSHPHTCIFGIVPKLYAPKFEASCEKTNRIVTNLLITIILCSLHFKPSSQKSLTLRFSTQLYNL